jgi:hypothetical protein
MDWCWKHPAVAAVLLLGASCVRVPPAPHAPAPAPSMPQPQCDQTLWKHVYAGSHKTAKDRLKVVAPCIIVTGTVYNYKAEPDGDYHIRVTVDAPFRSLLNSRNMAGQHGHLVVEPVCSHLATQGNVRREGVCKDFSQKVFNARMTGKHVSVTGAYVEDMDHGWMEIHPVTSITVLP